MMDRSDFDRLVNSIQTEIAGILGLRHHILRDFVGWVLHKPVVRFAAIWEKVDTDFVEGGTSRAGSGLLPNFISQMTVRGEDHIPASGPCIIASNHPGAYDSAMIVASIQRRDLKILISGIQFLADLPNLGKRFIMAAAGDTSMGMQALRDSIAHLQTGGALFIFPSGLVDPDPEVYPDAYERLQDWSSSLEIFLRKVPETVIVPTVASGVVSRVWAHHFLTSLVSKGWKRRRFAEFGQIISQLIRPGRLLLSPHLSFGEPVALNELTNYSGRLVDAIIQRESNELDRHLAWVTSLEQT